MSIFCNLCAEVTFSKYDLRRNVALPYHYFYYLAALFITIFHFYTSFIQPVPITFRLLKFYIVDGKSIILV